jgi:SAM-dependent methyltransferase
MSDRLRDPIAFIRVNGGAAYVKRLISEGGRIVPWTRPLLRATGLYGWTLPTRARLAQAWLRGEGLEVGAQAAPLAVPAGVRVRYVDTATCEETLASFPHLDPASVVTPDLITDGFRLDGVGDGTQDFVIANHVLEHSPDPIDVLRCWLRVLRRGGVLFASVPIAARCFDRDRPITALAHLIEDFEVARREGPDALAERNRPHYHEWMTLSMPALSREEGRPLLSPDEQAAYEEAALRKRQEIHFHTFTPESYRTLLLHVGGMADRRATLLTSAVANNEVIAVVRRS